MNSENEIKRGLLDVCKVKGWDSDINILGFHVLCDKLKQLGADEEREACCSIVWGLCESDNVAQRTVDAIRARVQACTPPQTIADEHIAKVTSDIDLAVNKALARPDSASDYGALCRDIAAWKQRRIERNFCPRCGKRTADLTTIHTCTPPQENT